MIALYITKTGVYYGNQQIFPENTAAAVDVNGNAVYKTWLDDGNYVYLRDSRLPIGFYAKWCKDLAALYRSKRPEAQR